MKRTGETYMPPDIAYEVQNNYMHMWGNLSARQLDFERGMNVMV